MSVKSYGAKATLMELNLSRSRIDYVMRNPTTFLYVELYYDQDGEFGQSEILGGCADTKDKIYVAIYDNRDAFSHKYGEDLLNEFKARLEVIYPFTKFYATDMDDDIIAALYTEEEIPLAYFYQGEYHLWKD